MAGKCPNCGKTDSWNSTFCSNCGTRMEKININCNWCGTKVSFSDKFCEGCGRSRHKALETSPPPLRTRIGNLFSELFSKKKTVTETGK